MARIRGWLARGLALIVWAWAVASIALFALFALRGDVTHPNVRARWQAALAPYGYGVVYPMREDFHVGDVFLSVGWRCGGVEAVSSAPGIALLGSLPRAAVAYELAAYYAGRPAFDATRLPADAARVAAGGAGEDATAGRPTRTDAAPSIFVASGDAAHLRALSLPGLEVGETLAVGSSWLAQHLPAGLARMFVTAGRDDSLSVTFSNIEEVGLPTDAARRVVKAFLAGEDARWMLRAEEVGEVARDLWAQMEVERRSQCPDPAEVSAEIRVVAVGRVLYARGLDYKDIRKATVEAGLGKPPADDAPAGPPGGAEAGPRAQGKIEQQGSLRSAPQTFSRALAFAYEPIVSSHPCRLFATMAGTTETELARMVRTATGEGRKPAWVDQLCPTFGDDDNTAAGAAPASRFADARAQGGVPPPAAAPAAAPAATPDPGSGAAARPDACSDRLRFLGLCPDAAAGHPARATILPSLPAREPGRGPTARPLPDNRGDLGQALRQNPNLPPGR